MKVPKNVLAFYPTPLSFSLSLAPPVDNPSVVQPDDPSSPVTCGWRTPSCTLLERQPPQPPTERVMWSTESPPWPLHPFPSPPPGWCLQQWRPPLSSPRHGEACPCGCSCCCSALWPASCSSSTRLWRPMPSVRLEAPPRSAVTVRQTSPASEPALRHHPLHSSCVFVCPCFHRFSFLSFQFNSIGPTSMLTPLEYPHIHDIKTVLFWICHTYLVLSFDAERKPPALSKPKQWPPGNY